MVKLVCCLRRRPDITREEFAKHWREKHIHAAGRDAAKVLGIRRYVQLHALPEAVNRELQAVRDGEDDFDGVAELWLDDADAYDRYWKSPEGAKALQAFVDDERENFVDLSRTVFFLAEENVVIDGPTS